MGLIYSTTEIFRMFSDKMLCLMINLVTYVKMINLVSYVKLTKLYGTQRKIITFAKHELSEDNHI